jgi:hypothetical protein
MTIALLGSENRSLAEVGVTTCIPDLLYAIRVDLWKNISLNWWRPGSCSYCLARGYGNPWIQDAETVSSAAFHALLLRLAEL